MSFWTPYVRTPDDGALDLSKRHPVKSERLSPREACAADSPGGPCCNLPASSISSASMSPQYQYYPADIFRGYPHEPAMVPALRLSPDSTASSAMYSDRRSSISPISVGAEAPSVWHASKCSPEGKKVPRPFKAVTRALEAEGQPEAVDEKYASFREAMLSAVRARNGGSLCVSNPKMRRAVRRSKNEQYDEEYLQRRARNNAAAKKSRDLRRLKEDELAIRTAFLEAENQRMRTELEAVRRQLALYQDRIHV